LNSSKFFPKEKQKQIYRIKERSEWTTRVVAQHSQMRTDVLTQVKLFFEKQMKISQKSQQIFFKMHFSIGL
jgi:hypothetical protein